jgi:hypothetical protein
MPSRFSGLAPETLVSRNQSVLPWDAYDDMPVDPNYISLAKRDGIARAARR